MCLSILHGCMLELAFQFPLQMRKREPRYEDLKKPSIPLPQGTNIRVKRILIEEGRGFMKSNAPLKEQESVIVDTFGFEITLKYFE